MNLRSVLCAPIVCATLFLVPPASAQTTTFTYQGRLFEFGVVANGVYDMTFTLYGSQAGADQVGDPVSRPGVTVSRGYLTVTLDFGPSAFTGEQRWLEVSVRGVVLSPRQEMTPTPYAMMANTAANLALPFEGAANRLGGPILGITNTGSGEAILGVSTNHIGVRGMSTTAFAVSGEAQGASATAVQGTHGPTGNYGYLGGSEHGVYGYSQSIGASAVYGVGNGSGVSGVVGESINGYGVQGMSDSNVGVRGESVSGPAVHGISQNNSGTLGESQNGPGVYGRQFASGNWGALGDPTYGAIGHSDVGTGVRGETVSGLAGEFIGPVQMTGGLTINTSGTAVNATVTGPGNGGYFNITNPDNIQEAVRGLTSGLGVAGQFTIDNPANTRPALQAETNGTGPALKAQSTGSGLAGEFDGSVFISGNVGIGTAAPNAALQVADDRQVMSFLGDHSEGLRVQGPDMINTYSLIGFDYGEHGKNLSQIGSYFTVGGTFLTFGTSNDYGTGITNQALTIDPAGRVGIGTSTPSATLEIMSPANQDEQIRLRNAAYPSRVMYLGYGVSFGGYARIGASDSLGPLDLSLQEYGGRVGIGTVFPQAELDVNGTTRTAGFQLTTATQAGYVLTSDVSGNGTWQPASSSPWQVSGGTLYYNAGNVGIGTSSPAAKLHVVGTTRTGVLEITGGSDLAEPFEIAGIGANAPGMVVVIDADHPGQLRLADKAYDRTVAGIVSGANGINPGLTMKQEGTAADGSLPVALTGRVYCWCDAGAGGAIAPGDLLTTSDTPGHAMKVTDHARAQGAIIGKAMTRLESGKGLVLVLVTLQ